MHGPADTAGATESSAYLGPGQVPRLFEWVVLSGMSVALCLVWLDLAHWLQSRQAGIDFASSRVAWGVYLAFQLANRLPVSFRYSPSGIWAAVDVVGFSAAFVAALLFGFDVQLHSPLRLVLAPLVVLWIATGIVYSTVIVVTGIFQGLNARYYFVRAARIREYVRDTPKWVLDLQRSTVLE